MHIHRHSTQSSSASIFMHCHCNLLLRSSSASIFMHCHCNLLLLSSSASIFMHCHCNLLSRSSSGSGLVHHQHWRQHKSIFFLHAQHHMLFISTASDNAKRLCKIHVTSTSHSQAPFTSRTTSMRTIISSIHSHYYISPKNMHATNAQSHAHIQTASHYIAIAQRIYLRYNIRNIDARAPQPNALEQESGSASVDLISEPDPAHIRGKAHNPYK
jgi:hypothetical protein